MCRFTAGGGATDENVTWKANPPSITISGDEKLLDGLNQIVLGRENLSTILVDTTKTYPIVLPDGRKRGLDLPGQPAVIKSGHGDFLRN